MVWSCTIRPSRILLSTKTPQTAHYPAKTNLQDHARLCKNLARILHARLAWHVHVVCPFLARFLHVSCTILAQSCTHLARNGARFCKNCCKNNYLHFLHIFCKILQESVQDCARIVQEKGHIACTCLHA